MVDDGVANEDLVVSDLNGRRPPGDHRRGSRHSECTHLVERNRAAMDPTW